MPPIGRTVQAGGPEVKIVTPSTDQPLGDPVIIQALVRSRGGASRLRVVAYLDDLELETLTKPPFRWIVRRPARATAVHVRVVAVDGSGRQGEDELMASRTPSARFEAEVQAVSLNLAALDESDRFISDLRPAELLIQDNGVEQQIMDFARGEAPLRIALLLDRSGSMADKMQGTLGALQEFLTQLGPQDEVKLMGFNQRVTSFTPFTNLHGLVASFAQGITAEGSTALFDALLYGYRQLATIDEARVRRVIFLLTDGEDRESRVALHPALDLVRKGGVTIYALGQGEALHDPDLRAVLEQLADATGGEAFFEDDLARLEGLFVRVAQAMRALYFVSYRPSDLSPGWHEIEVQVRRPGLRLRHKPGYMREVSSGHSWREPAP